MRNFKLVLLSNLVYAASQWLVLVIMSKFYSAEDTALFIYVLSLSAPLVILFTMKHATLYISDSKQNISISDFFFYRVVCFLLFIPLTVLFLTISGEASFFNVVMICTGVCFFKLAEVIDELRSAFYLKTLDFRKSARIKVLRSICFIMTFYILTLLEVYFYFSYLISAFIIFVYSLIKMNKHIECNFSLNQIPSLFRLGAPLGAASVIAAFSSNIPKYVSFNVMSSEDMVILSCIMYFNVLLVMIVNALGQYYLPIFKLNNAKSPVYSVRIYGGVCMKLFFISFFISIPFYFFGGELLTFLYNSSFSSFGWAISVVIVAFAIKGASALFGTLLNSLEIYKIQWKISIINLILTLLISVPAILLFGIKGAFCSLIFIYTLELLIFFSLGGRYSNDFKKAVPTLFK